MTENHEVVVEEETLFGIITNSIIANTLTPSSSIERWQNGKIRKVPCRVRLEENTSPYTPRIISIGPLHHGKPELRPMQDLKGKYLFNLLNREGNGRVYDELRNRLGDGLIIELLERIKTSAKEMEEKARSFYLLSNEINSDDFVNMLVLDGCFLIEFFLDRKFLSPFDNLERKLRLIEHDILLFENQVPFFVLEGFHKILMEFGICTIPMVEIAKGYLTDSEMYGENETFQARKFGDFEPFRGHHLLHIYHKKLFNRKPRPPFSKTTKFRNWTMALFWSLFGFLFRPMFFIHRIFFADSTMFWRRPTSAMELEEAGVRFQPSFTDLKFEQGTLFVPILTLNHGSICLLKNLLALETYYHETVPPYALRYAGFIKNLIKHPGDLKVMEKHNIILRSSNADESVRLVRDHLEDIRATYYNWREPLSYDPPLIIQLHLLAYCKEPSHRWRAKLMRDYFESPWSILGVIVGFILLALTTLQTAYTVLSYHHPPK